MPSNYKKNRFRQILESENWSDCIFVVGGEKIKAHKLMLACSSPVFENMLYGDWITDEIEITDATVEDFKAMLSYVYTEEVPLKSTQQAWNLVYLGEKYFLVDLMDKYVYCRHFLKKDGNFCILFFRCVDYIKKNLTIRTLVLSYEYSVLYNLSNLGERCLRDICEHIKEVLLLSEYHMKLKTLEVILREWHSYYDHPEYVLMGIVNWAVCECDRLNIEASLDNVKLVLKDNNLTEKIKSICFFPVSGFGNLNRKKVKRLLHVYDLTRSISDELDLYGDSREKKTNLMKTIPIRGYFKIMENQRFWNVAVFSTVVMVQDDCCLSAVAVSTLHMPADAKFVKYEGEICITVASHEGHEFKNQVKGYFSYDTYTVIEMEEFIVLKRGKIYSLNAKYIVPAEGEILTKCYNDEPQVSFIRFNPNNFDVFHGVKLYPL